MPHATIRLFGVCTLVLAFVLAACDDDNNGGASGGNSPPPGGQGGESKVCASLDRLEESLVRLGSLSPSSSGKDAEKAADEVQDAFNDVRNAAGDEARDEIDNLERAWDDLRDAVRNIDENQSLSDTVNMLRQRVTAVVDAGEDLYRQFNCQ